MRTLTLFTFLSIAAVTDVKCMKISNRLIACGLIWGLFFQIWGNGFAGVLYFILNITIPVVLFILLFQMHALGAGDIKLFSVTGSFLTTEQLLKTMVLSFLLAAVLGMGKRLYQCLTQKKREEPYTKIHFSIEILLAVVLVTGRCMIG